MAPAIRAPLVGLSFSGVFTDRPTGPWPKMARGEQAAKNASLSSPFLALSRSRFSPLYGSPPPLSTSHFICGVRAWEVGKQNLVRRRKAERQNTPLLPLSWPYTSNEGADFRALPTP